MIPEPKTFEEKNKRNQLANLINARFNNTELEDLFFELGIERESVVGGGAGKKRKINELISYGIRHPEQIGKDKYRYVIYSIVEAVDQHLPDVDMADYVWFEWPYPGTESESETDSQSTTAAEKAPQQVSSTPSFAKETESGDYVNFDIFIDAKREDGYPVRAGSTVGETEKAIRQPFPHEDAEFADTLYFLSELSATEDDAINVGNKLSSFLFPPKIQGLFAAAKARAQAEGKKGLRIRLHITGDAPEMTRIPWEYCRDDRSFLALDDATPMVRYTSVGTAVSATTTPEKVRILLATAGPKDRAPIDIDAQVQRVQESLKSLIDAGRVELKVIPHATRRELRMNFRRYDPHILHFLGHGAVEDGDGVLLLEDNDGNTSKVDADDMYVLARSSNVKLVVLSSCQTAAHGEENTSDAIMGMAPKLVAAGVPAVVAMQYEVPEETAVAFVRDMYQFLADGEPLDTAVTEARIGVYFDNDDKLFWAIPVLFMRSPDGRIW